MIKSFKAGPAGEAFNYTMAAAPDRILFSPTPQSTLVHRLAGAVRDASGEMTRGPASYLRLAFFSEGFADLLPVRLARKLADTLIEIFTHPIRFISNSFPPEWIRVLALDDSTLAIGKFIKGIFFAGAISSQGKRARPRRRFRPALAASAAAHSVLIIYLLYIAILSPFAHLRVVNKAYRQLDTTQILGPLHYPPGMLARQQPTGPTLSIEEIRERDRKRREERLAREKAEREKEERERAEREKAEKEKQALADADKKEAEKDQTPTQFGEINEAPIKDIISKVYAIYKAGDLDLPEPYFTVMATFKIDRDGSLPKSHIKLIKSSGSKIIDENAIEILWRIGESHALGPISDLTSNSIRLELTEDMTRLTITGFASNPEIAKQKAKMLNDLFALLRWAKSNSATAELISLIKVTSSNNRVDANMTISRERASEMMRTRFGNGQ